jgi:hypothetical protein
MCPVCIATAMLIAGSVASTGGGLAAVGIWKFGGKNTIDNHPAPSPSPTPSKEDRHG